MKFTVNPRSAWRPAASIMVGILPSEPHYFGRSRILWDIPLGRHRHMNRSPACHGAGVARMHGLPTISTHIIRQPRLTALTHST